MSEQEIKRNDSDRLIELTYAADRLVRLRDANGADFDSCDVREHQRTTHYLSSRKVPNHRRTNTAQSLQDREEKLATELLPSNEAT